MPLYSAYKTNGRWVFVIRNTVISKKALAAITVIVAGALILSFAIPAFAQGASQSQGGFFQIISEGFETMKEDIYNVLIHNDNYKHITNGLWVTIYITFFALIIYRKSVV